jgi:hypothetical protein
MASTNPIARRLATGLTLAVSLAGSLALPLATAPATQAAATAKTYKNCTALNKVYPHGVGRVGAHDKTSSGSPVTNFKRKNAVYNANTKSDRDHDKIACEKA